MSIITGAADDVSTRPVLAIFGPTGSGKSKLALSLALTFGGEIVGCDSIQVYRGLDIGSAKTPPRERHGIPHHMIDIADPNEIVTAGTYARLAQAAIAQIHARSALPVVVGGTGLYARALFEGLSPAPQRNVELRSTLAAREVARPGVLHRYLSRVDPDAAARIHPNDVQKLIRAVEITRLARLPTSDVQRRPRQRPMKYAVLKLGLSPERNELGTRIERRAANMFEAGILEETQEILHRYPAARNFSPLQAIGYRQALAVLDNVLLRNEAIREATVRTRQYAKRQLTWFKTDPEINWIFGFGETRDCLETSKSRIRVWISANSWNISESI